jgi:FXSXX-COOH protein
MPHDNLKKFAMRVLPEGNLGATLARCRQEPVPATLVDANPISSPQSLAAPRQAGSSKMDVTDQGYTVVSDVTDLDRVRLADLQVMTDEATSGLLRRIVPATPSQGVPVAAFNSHV